LPFSFSPGSSGSSFTPPTYQFENSGGFTVNAWNTHAIYTGTVGGAIDIPNVVAADIGKQITVTNLSTSPTANFSFNHGAVINQDSVGVLRGQSITFEAVSLGNAVIIANPFQLTFKQWQPNALFRVNDLIFHTYPDGTIVYFRAQTNHLTDASFGLSDASTRLRYIGQNLVPFWENFFATAATTPISVPRGFKVSANSDQHEAGAAITVSSATFTPAHTSAFTNLVSPYLAPNSNLPTNYTLTQTQIDRYDSYAQTQTTANISVTLPTPSNTDQRKIFIVSSTILSTAAFTVSNDGRRVEPGSALTYVWNGAAWVSVNPTPPAVVAPLLNRLHAILSNFGNNGLTTTGTVSGDVYSVERLYWTTAIHTQGGGITFQQSDGTFTISQPGVYEVECSPNPVFTPATQYPFTLKQLNNTAAGITIASTSHASPSGNSVDGTRSTVLKATIVVPAGQTLRYVIEHSGGWTSNAYVSSFAGRHYITVTQISGNATYTGLSVDHSFARVSSAQVVPATTQTDIPCTLISGNLGHTPVNGWLLLAGKTYTLSSKLKLSAATGTNPRLLFAWVDASNNVLANSTLGSCVPASTNTQVTDVDAYALFTPTVDTLVKLRSQVGVGTNCTLSIDSTVTIQQIGASSNTKQTLAAVGGFVSGRGAGDLLQMSTPDYNIGNAWNTSTHTFTAPRTARYLVCGCAGFAFSNVTSSGRMMVYLTGGSTRRLGFTFQPVFGGNEVNGLAFTGIIQLTAGQTIQINLQANFTAASTSLLTNPDSGLHIHELPPDFIL
jgi:hypothetical protein